METKTIIGIVALAVVISGSLGFIIGYIFGSIKTLAIVLKHEVND